MKTLKQKFVVFFIGLVAVTLLSGMFVVWTINKQMDDGLVINLAGRQRMLSQKMSKEVLALNLGNGEVDTLKATIQQFDKTLEGLINGDKTLNLPSTQVPIIRSQLQQVKELWRSFRENITIIVETAGKKNEGMLYLQENNTKLLNLSNAVVVAMEQAGLPPSYVNLAGRQRMLSQKLAKELFLLNLGMGDEKELKQSINEYRQTVLTLLSGDSTQRMEGVKNLQVRGELDAVWGFGKNLKT